MELLLLGLFGFFFWYFIIRDYNDNGDGTI